MVYDIDVHFQCIGGPSGNGMTCLCPRPDHTFGNRLDEAHLCYLGVGSICDPKDEHPCVELAECSLAPNKKTYACECRRGLVENRNRKCDIAYGQLCGNNSTTQLPCDTVAGLVCNEGICECKNLGDIYEPDRRQCSTPIGISCNRDAACVKKAFCKKVENARDFGFFNIAWGRCTPLP